MSRIKIRGETKVEEYQRKYGKDLKEQNMGEGEVGNVADEKGLAL